MMAQDVDDRTFTKACKKYLKCSTCNNTVGTISAEGLLELNDTNRQTCDSCRPFEELHAAVLATTEEFKAVQHRRQDFGGRINALSKKMEANKAFANFVLKLEQADDPHYPSTQETSHGPPEDSIQDGGGEKRRRSITPIEGISDPVANKRPKGLKVRFHESVDTYDDGKYRVSGSFRRNGEDYVPGKFAPHKGQKHLDTSGSLMEYKDFYHMKWVGRKWVSMTESEIVEQEELGESSGTSNFDSTQEGTGDETEQFRSLENSSSSDGNVLEAGGSISDPDGTDESTANRNTDLEIALKTALEDGLRTHLEDGIAAEDGLEPNPSIDGAPLEDTQAVEPPGSVAADEPNEEAFSSPNSQPEPSQTQEAKSSAQGPAGEQTEGSASTSNAEAGSFTDTRTKQEATSANAES